MPADDVSDLRDVVDAINRLCETMKTSDYVEPQGDEACEDVAAQDVCDVLVEPEEVVVNEVETYVAELWSDASSAWVESIEAEVSNNSVQDEVIETVIVNPPPRVIENIVSVTSNKTEDLQNVPSNRLDVVENVTIVEKSKNVTLDSSSDQSVNVETVSSNLSVTDVENLNVSNVSSNIIETVKTTQPSGQIQNIEPVVLDRSITRPEDIRAVVSDPDLLTMSFEPASEMYYTASSEVSLLSDLEMPERIPQEESLDGREILTRDNRDGVMAGHVAAMRERFESMTRTNTPCPDLMRSVSPSLDVYRNITPSPDHLG